MFKRLKILSVLLFIQTAVYAQYVPTPNIGLEVPANGSNNWNIPLNYNFNRIDQLLSGHLALPSLHVSGNVIVDGSVQANSFVGAGGAGLATASVASQWSPVYYSATPNGNSFAGVTPFSGLAKYSATGPPSAAILSDINTLLLGGTGCNTDGTVYSPFGSKCVTAGGSVAGSSLDVQFNNSGAFAADTGFFSYTIGTHTLGTTNLNNTGTITSKITNQNLNSDTFLTSPGSNNGVANALSSSTCTPGPCTTTRPPLSTDTSNVPLPPSGDTVIDYSRGGTTTVGHNPRTSLAYRPGTGSGYDCVNIATLDCVTGYLDSPDYASSTPDVSRPVIRIGAASFNKWSWNYGNAPDTGTNQWGPAGTMDQLFPGFNSQGITQVRSSNALKHADGDFSSLYAYFYGDGGQPDYSGEGGNNMTLEGGETSDYFHGVVGAGATFGTSSLPITYNSGISTANRNATTADGIMIDISEGTGQMHVTGPSTSLSGSSGFVNLLPIDTSVIPSTAYGNSTCEMPVPHVLNPNLPGSITCTFNNILGSTGLFTTGHAMLSGDFPEVVTITNVVGTGTSQSVTLTYLHPHGATHTMLWQGGNTIQTYLSYDQYYNIGNFRYVFHVYGATDATHLATEPKLIGTTPNPYIAPMVTGAVTQSGTTVTASVFATQTNGLYNNQPSAVVSGCSDPGFNQNVTNLKWNLATQVFTWTSPGTGTTCAAATVTLPSSFFAFHLYPGAEQYGPSIAAPNTLPLEPNDVSWTPGDLIEMPHNFQWSGRDIRTYWQVMNPLARFGGNNHGITHDFVGPGIGGQFNMFQLGNQNPCSIYVSCGGTLLLGPSIVIGTGGNPRSGGINGGGMRLGTAPINQGAIISTGCLPSDMGGCSNADPILFSAFDSRANSQMYWFPDTDTYGAAGFEASTYSLRGYGSFKGGSYWLNGYQQQGHTITFSSDGTTKTQQLGLCQYNDDKLILGNCNPGPTNLDVPDGRLDAAILNAQASSQIGGLTIGMIAPVVYPSPTYTGTAGSTTRAYSFVAVGPNGIETPMGHASNSVTNTAATLDASNYVTIPCPTALQINYPAGTTYRVYESLTPVQLIGNCTIGSSIQDTGVGTTQNPSTRTDGGTSSLGELRVEFGGDLAFWNSNTSISSLDTFITRSASGTINIGTTKNAFNGTVKAGTFNGSFTGSGAGLSAVPAASLTGTVAVSALPVAVVGTNGISQPDNSSIGITSGVLATKGFSGSFTTADSKTCTVVLGLITGCI